MCLPNYLYSSPIGNDQAVDFLCNRLRLESNYLVVDILARQLQLTHQRKTRCQIINTNSYEDWFRRIDKDARNQIRQSERRGVSIRQTDFNETVKIAEASALKQGHSLDKEWFSKMVSFAQEHGVTLGAEVDKKIVAFVILYEFNGTGHLVKHSSLGDYQACRPNHALYAAAVRWCAERGIKRLNTGGSPTKSLTAFKKSLGTKSHIYYWYSK